MVADPHRYRGTIVPVLLLCLWSGFFGFNPAHAAAPDVSNSKKIIVLGRVSNNPRKTHLRLTKLAGYLAERLRPLGIMQGKAIVAKNNREMIRYLRSGQIDFISETVMTALFLEEKVQAEILLREWKKKVG